MPYYGNPKNALTWDIVLEGDSQSKNIASHQIKLFSNTAGQIASINLCYGSGLNPNYKKKKPGIEISYSQEKSSNEIWKITKLKETQFEGVFAYEDIIQYNKKGKLLKSTFIVPECK